MCPDGDMENTNMANPDYSALYKLSCRLDHLPSQKLNELLFPCVPVNNACVMVSTGKKEENKKREHTLLLQVFKSHISDVNPDVILFSIQNTFYVFVEY